MSDEILHSAEKTRGDLINGLLVLAVQTMDAPYFYHLRRMLIFMVREEFSDQKPDFGRGSNKMTTLKHVGEMIIDSTGPLRKIRLPDGLYVVGEQMLIAVESDEEADEIIEELKNDYGIN